MKAKRNSTFYHKLHVTNLFIIFTLESKKIKVRHFPIINSSEFWVAILVEHLLVFKIQSIEYIWQNNHIFLMSVMELKYPLIPMASFNLDCWWQVKYADVEANNGNVVTPTQVKSEPQLSWSAEEGAFYTVCMTGGCALQDCTLLQLFYLNKRIIHWSTFIWVLLSWTMFYWGTVFFGVNGLFVFSSWSSGLVC